MRRPTARTPRQAMALAALVAAAALAGTPAFAQANATDNAPTESSLIVGALQIGSATALEITSYDIMVAPSGVTYTYQFKNNGSSDLTLAAAVSLPELRASADGSETWTLAGSDPQNFVDLSVAVAGTPVALQTQVRATALGVERAADLKAENLPLIPFGPATEKALAALPSEAADRLAALGLVSPRDPAQPDAPLIADWTLDVVRTWQLVLPPGKTTAVAVKFTPVVSHYPVVKGDEQDLEEAKDEICIKQQVLATLEARLKAGGAWNVTDISLADDPPARWIASPPAKLSVQKPRPEAIVVFCGMDERSAGKPAVLGVAPDENNGIRIVIFEPAAK
jgi:hypothetical protein